MKMSITWREVLLNTLLVVVSSATAWLFIEMSVWAVFPEKRAKLLANIVDGQARGSLTDGHFTNVYEYNSEFGWLPIADHSGWKWDRPVKLLANGIRSNGSADALPNRPNVLVVGDSYTFGDEVSDGETWPAQLAQQSGIRVLNGAVSSFGLDQMILRAEALDPIYQPDIIVVALIADSVNRVGARVRHGAHKPFFVVRDDALALQNVPVPRADRVEPSRHLLGYSYVLHFIMPLLAKEYWWKGTFYDFRTAGNDSVDVSCRLIRRLADFVTNRGRKLVVAELIFEADSTLDPVYVAFRPCLKGIAASHITVASTQKDFLAGVAKRSDFLQSIRNPEPDSHLSPAGNDFVARSLLLQMRPLLESISNS